MARASRAKGRVEPFGEREFYLEEFRGRAVLIAIAPSVVLGHAPLRSLTAAVSTLVQNDTRVVVWWPAVVPAAERRLLAALGRAPAKVRRWKARKKKVRRRPSSVLRLRVADLASPGGEKDLRSALWTRLRASRLCVLAVSGPAAFPRQPLELAAALRVSKVVLTDPGGGLVAGSSRLSFVDENQLDTLVRHGEVEAEWTGLGDRRALLVSVREALDRGIEQVNLCAPDGIGEELFTYAGSGTLFTEGDYTRVGPLGLDDFAQAERLLERGQLAGVLKARSAEEIGQLLASGYGVTVCGRHLAGVAGLLTAPYQEERMGEIVGLYTITRFKGEGLGDRLVARILQDAEAQGLVSVFAVTVDERAREFFERMGFAAVGPDGVPAAKWRGYDPKRRQHVAVLERRLPVQARAAEANR